MHDDLPCMDDAELRRGHPTTHRVHGVEATARAGATLIPLAVLQAWRGELALGCDPGTGRRIVSELCRAAGAGGMVGGQAVDLRAEGARLGAAELDRLHALKTGALLTAALRIGGVVAGASAPVIEALDRYGEAIGLAYQIADDLLDATASAEELGKNPSDDALDKTTYVAVHGFEDAAARARAEVARAHAALGRRGDRRSGAPRAGRVRGRAAALADCLLQIIAGRPFRMEKSERPLRQTGDPAYI